MPDELRITAPSLVAMLSIEGRAKGTGGFRDLAAAIGGLIQRGDVPVGTRLPTERSLATQLARSRGTVVAAYDLLRDDGLVVRRQGSGTWVRPTHGVVPAEPTAAMAAALRARQLTARVIRPAVASLVDLAVSTLNRPWMLDPTAFDIPMDELVTAGHGHGYVPLGVDSLRCAMAARSTARGLSSEAADIAVTQGSLHAISLLARLLVRPGDSVAIERPTFPGAIDAFSRAGASFVAVPTGGAGVDVDRLAAAVADPHVRVVYLVPTVQNPIGSVMPEARRREVARIIDRSDAWLIEDDTLAATAFGDRPAPIAAHGRSDRFIVLGSLAKEVWAGLRIGWIRAPRRLIDRVARLRAADDLGAPVHGQLTAVRVFDGIDDRTALLRVELARRAEVLISALADQLPSWQVHRPDGGLSVWCRLPGPLGDELAAVAPRFGVAVLPGSSATTDESGADHVRLSFGDDADRIELGVQRLAAAWGELSR